MFAAPDLAWLGNLSRQPLTPSLIVADPMAVARLRPMPATLVIDVPREEGARLLASAPVGLVRSVPMLMLIDGQDEAFREQAMTKNIACLARSITDAQLRLVISASVQRVHTSRANGALAVGCLAAQRAVFVIRTLDEAESLATVLSMLCPEPTRRVAGFVELLVNAIEHGNLEISRELKNSLLKSGQWLQTVRSRLADARYSHRAVRVEFERSATESVFIIEDEGSGFDFEKAFAQGVEQGDALHGRGIALARSMSFDELRYEGRGNRVVAVIR